MEKNILLIGDRNSFMVKKIHDSLKENGFCLRILSPDAFALQNIQETYHVYMLQAGEKIKADILVNLKNRIREADIQLFVFGNSDMFGRIYDIIPQGDLADVFSEPFRMEWMMERLRASFAASELEKMRKRILIVDSDPVALNAIKTWMAGNYRIYVASSGMNAVTFLASNDVDLVLLDYEMPVISGAQVLEMLRSDPHTADIPVMLMTSKKDKEAVMKLVALRPVKYLSKNMSPQELEEQVADFFVSSRIMLRPQMQGVNADR